MVDNAGSVAIRAGTLIDGTGQGVAEPVRGILLSSCRGRGRSAVAWPKLPGGCHGRAARTYRLIHSSAR